MRWQCCTQYVSKFEKFNTGHRKQSVFMPIPKKGNAKECSNYHTIALISYASNVRLKLLKAGLQQYMNWELPHVQARFRKGRGTRDQIANIHGIIEKVRELQKKTSISASLTTLKPLTVWITTNWKSLQEMGIPNHVTCLLWNLYAGQEGTFRIGHEITDWSQIGKGVHQGYILSPCLFNFYAEYIMQNARLDEAQAGIQITGEISITSDIQMTPPLRQKVKRN